MELQLEQQQIPCLIPCAERSIEERFSADYVVPDSLPDAAELLFVEGDLCLWRLDLSDGSAELEGELSARISCADDQGAPMGFPARVPIQFRIRADGIGTGQRPFVNCTVKSMTAHLINSRKIRLQGTLVCSLATYTASEVTVTTGIRAEDCGVFTNHTAETVPYISAVEEQVFTAGDTLALKNGVPADGRLISYASVLIADECECREQQVNLKGRIRSELLYVDAETKALTSETIETPFFCLMDVGAKVSACRFSLHLTSAEIQCRNDEPAVDAAFHLLVQTICYAKQEIEIVTDAYSNRFALHLEWQEQVFSAYSQLEEEHCTAEETIHIETAGKTICAIRAGRKDQRITITALLTDENRRLSSVSGVLETELPSDASVCVDLPSTKIGTDCITVHVPYRVQRKEQESRIQRILVSADSEEAKTRPQAGVTLVRREETMDLWQLARDHASSVEAILAANPERDQMNSWIVLPHVY